MKYCGAFFNKHRLRGITAFDELKINYRDNQEKLINFFNYAAGGERTVIVKIESTEDMIDIILKGYLEEYAKLEKRNFQFVLPPITNDNAKTIFPFIEELIRVKIPFFFSERAYTIDAVWQMIDLGASQVYVCGELCFELANIAQRIHDVGVKIRVYPDIAMSSSPLVTDYKKFFIRPEDIQYYENFIDVCEFYQEEEGMLEILHDAYCLQKGWTLSLSKIIEDLNTEINNLGITKHFGERRSRCGKSCMKNGQCDLCWSAISLADILDKANMELKDMPEEENQDED